MASRDATLKFIARLPEEEILRPATQDRWSVKDVLAHLLTCDEETVRRFRLLAKGRGDRIQWFESMADADRFNARSVARGRGRSAFAPCSAGWRACAPTSSSASSVCPPARFAIRRTTTPWCSGSPPPAGATSATTWPR